MNYLKKTALITLISLIVITPISSFADSKGDKGEREREKIENKIEKERQKMENKIEKLQQKIQKKVEKRLDKENSPYCWNGFIHRVFPFVWFKNNINNINIDDDCFVRPDKATTTDTTAPVISNITTRTGQVRAIVLWNTNERTTDKLYYSTSSPASTSNSSVMSMGGKNHYVVLNNLIPGTTYYAFIESKDKAQNTTNSNQFSFVTKTSTTTVDITPPIISAVSSTTSTSSLQVAWNTNEPATSKVYYSTSTPLSTSTALFVGSGTFVNNHSVLIDGLSTSTNYYLVIESSDSSANTATSSEFSLTTSP